MPDYDFLTLSPFEFEALTRDLLQAHLGVYLESFGLGADAGIDLRYAAGKGFIVQCKRYNSFDSLYQALKKEVPKVKKLALTRYLLVTTLPMLPDRKAKIQALFAPYILTTADIFGREDLNNLLSLNPKIEQDNFKLWLSSTNILQVIVNRQIINQSKFVLDEIKDKLKVYVQNSSFFEASQILKDNHYIIISGIPGIGKTTLAEILVFDALARGFEQFIFLSDSISEGFQMFDEQKSQVFLFDDFLGSNFLEHNLGTNEEKQIIRFIKKVKWSENKLLIFTTREYILNQARLSFEELDREELIKCVMDLSKYTKFVRAKILYNHLFFNRVPYSCIEHLIGRNYLLKIIEHPNYSPRIIEYFSQQKLWEGSPPDAFPDNLLGVFTSPYKVWQHAFENQITDQARLVLYSLLIGGREMQIAQLFKQVRAFMRPKDERAPLLSDTIFKRALRELDNSFIQLIKDQVGDTLIRYHNPSIQDFLVDYVDKDPEIKKNILLGSVFLKQALAVFHLKPSAGWHQEKKMTLTSGLKKAFVQRFMRDMAMIEFTAEPDKYVIPSADDLLCLKLLEMETQLELGIDWDWRAFVQVQFDGIIYSNKIGNRGVQSYTQLLMRYYEGNEELDVERILVNITPSLYYLDDFRVLQDFQNFFPNAYEKFKEEHEDEYFDIFSSALTDLADNSSDDKDDLINNIQELQELQDYYGINTDDERYTLQEHVDRIERQEQAERDEHYYNQYYSRPDARFNKSYSKGDLGSNEETGGTGRHYSERERIESIFRSLGES